MAAVKLLVIAGPHERERICRSATAAGGAGVAADPGTDFERLASTLRPDAVVVASGPFLPDPPGTVRRLRAAVGPRVPIVFVGEAGEAGAVEPLVAAAYARPVAPDALVSRTIALTVRPGRAVAAAPPADRGALRRVAASIDEALDAEMLAALRTAVEERRPPENGRPTLSMRAVVDGLEGEEGELLGTAAAGPPEGAAPRPAAQAGELADVDTPMLLGRLFAEGVTGRLLVRRAGVERTVYLEAGRPVLATSNSPEDRMIEWLVRAGRISASQYQAAVAAAEETGRRMGALLVELGFLKSTDLLAAVRGHYEEIVLSLFSWTEGQWRIEPGVMADPRESRLLRHPAALVREGVRRGYAPERLWARLGSPRNVFRADLRGAAADVAAEVADGPAERAVLLSFDGVRSIEEVVRVAAVPAETVARIALALWCFGLLHPAADAARAPGEVRPDARDLALERERVRARHALAVEGDYFRFLGVAPDASPQEIRRAHDQLARALSPEAVGPELERELEAELRAVREVLADALLVLGAERLREAYRAALAGAGG